MKSILNPVALALFISLAGQAAFAQDTVFVSQVPPPQAEPQTELQTVPQENPQPDYQAAPQAAAPAPTYQAAPQPVYQAVPQPAPQSVYQPVPQNAELTNPRRSSFYLNGGLGVNFAYFYYNHITHNEYYNQHSQTKYDGSGIGLTAELTLGVIIKELIGIHGTIEFSNINGEYDINSEQKNDVDTDIDAMMFAFGPGLTVLPFSRAGNFLEGTYFSAKLLYAIILLNMPQTNHVDNSKDSFIGVGASLEIGKDWHLSEKANAGVALKWELIGFSSNDELDEKEHYKHFMNSLQLVVRINRR